MKKSLITSVLFVLVLIFTTGLSVRVQEAQTKNQRKLEKARLKREQASQDSLQQIVYKQLLDTKYYMIGINQAFPVATQMVRGGQGVENTTLSSMTNFVFVMGDSVILQVASPAYVGSNGVGGFTVKGRIQDYTYKPAKENSDKPGYVTFHVESNHSVGTLMVNITLYAEGRADVSFGASAYQLQGNLLDPQTAKYIIGTDVLE
jgi:hypothetical protein